MKPPPKSEDNIVAAKAVAEKHKNNQPPPRPHAHDWPELTAVRNYGPRSSHPKGSCKYSFHRNYTDHCWSGCNKCGGCFVYHKRRRLINEGRRLCPIHKYSAHLQSECRGARSPSKRSRNGNQHNRSRSPLDARDSRRDISNTRSYNARSACHRRSRSRSISPPPRTRRRSRSFSQSPERAIIPAHYVKPKYLRDLDRFAKHGRPPRHHRTSSPRSAHTNDSESKRSSRSALDLSSNQYPSASAMQTQHARRRDKGHIPLRDDGKPNIYDLIHDRNRKHQRSQKTACNAPRRVVASAATNTRTRIKQLQTCMDSGAGTTICNDDELYTPGERQQRSGR